MQFKKIKSLADAKILLTNDDGIDAEGLKVLEEEISKISGNVWVVAPKVQRSGASHAITPAIFKMENHFTPENLPEYVSKIDDRHFAVDGTPADCVKVGSRLLGKNHFFDLVISGINLGRNTSEDITYSGTLGAAMEALISGIPAIAFSQHLDKDQTTDWKLARKFTAPLAELCGTRQWPINTFISINFPNGSFYDFKGLRVTRGGEKRFSDNPGIYAMDNKNNLCGEYAGSPVAGDAQAIENGYISISPLKIDLTDYDCISEVEKLINNFCENN